MFRGGRNFERDGNASNMFRGSTMNGPRTGSRFSGSSNWDEWDANASTDGERGAIPPLMATVSYAELIFESA